MLVLYIYIYIYNTNIPSYDNVLRAILLRKSSEFSSGTPNPQPSDRQ